MPTKQKRQGAKGRRPRHYIDPPLAERCLWTVVLKDGSTAQCGRRVTKGSVWCWQHHPRREGR